MKRLIFGALILFSASYLGYSGYSLLCFFGYLAGFYFIVTAKYE